MAVHKRKGSSFYYYEFEMLGERFRGSTGTANKADAMLVEAQKRKEQRELVANPGKAPMRLEPLTGLWLDDGRVNRADWQNDESRVRKLLGFERRNGEVIRSGRHALDGSMWVHEFSAKHLADLVTARQREGNSGATINRELALIQALLEFARKAAVKLPAVPLEFPDYKQAERKGKLRYLSVDEEQQLLTALVAKQAHYTDPKGMQARMIQDQFDLVVFLLDTGARYDEVASIRKDCVDLDRGTIELYRSKVDNEGGLALTQRLWGLLRVRFAAVPGPYIFPAWDRGAVDETKPRGWSTNGIQKTMDALGFNAPALVLRKGKATAHTFRDTFAARQIKAGATLYEVQLLLGHSSPKMTQKYAHMDEELGARAASRLDGLHGVTPGVTTKPPQVDDPIEIPGGAAALVPTIVRPQAPPSVAESRYSKGQEKPEVIDLQRLPAGFLAPRPGLEPGTYGLTEQPLSGALPETPEESTT